MERALHWRRLQLLARCHHTEQALPTRSTDGFEAPVEQSKKATQRSNNEMDGGGQSQSPGITLNLFATTVFWSVPFVITLSFYGALTFFISFFELCLEEPRQTVI